MFDYCCSNKFTDANCCKEENLGFVCICEFGPIIHEHYADRFAKADRREHESLKMHRSSKCAPVFDDFSH